MTLFDLTPEQKQALKKEIADEMQAKAAVLEEERETYKTIASDTVEEYFPQLEILSAQLAKLKKEIFESFASVIELKEEIYGVKSAQKSHTFSNRTGNKRIQLGYRTLDRYDDTAEAGIAKIKQYIETLVDKDNADLVTIINSLLKKDDKGNLKASRVLELRKLSQKIKNPLFTDGVKILADAFSAEFSANFIAAEYKDSNNTWHPVNLSITAVK